MATQIYFIDTKLNNYQSIIDSLSSTDKYFLIDSSSDGLTQMSNVLLNYSNLDSKLQLTSLSKYFCNIKS
ncbi:DUF4347 domain-containing protein [Aliarcobacter sp. ERUVET-8]|uniref:DUF4347 domain-containing protein n=1 Tax=Aliarcobacter sp. ERUVET-8 TaxID=3429684 RepID=UPI003D6AA2A8